MAKKRPKLRTVDKYSPPFKLNKFPPRFDIGLGKAIIYLLATRGRPKVEGDEWERIFADLIQARWKPSNVGLDDVVFEQTAWSAKTVKAKSPSTTKRVRLISGRNSVAYSYDEHINPESDPNVIGRLVLEIWNERINGVRSKYENLRTVILLKSHDLLELAVFEVPTRLYDPTAYSWTWNDQKNLIGISSLDQQHHFTWQPHGSQFTIIEDVPPERLAIQLRQPPELNQDDVLNTINFDPSWVVRL